MTFKGYLAVDSIDIQVAATNGTVLEWYGSIQELIDDCGIHSDITEIDILEFDLELPDGYIMTFEDIGLN